MAKWLKYIGMALKDGRPEPNVKVYVWEPGTQDEITIYEDRGETPINQPVLTDSAGMFSFFVDVETYPSIRLFFEKEGIDFTLANTHHEEVTLA